VIRYRLRVEFQLPAKRYEKLISPNAVVHGSGDPRLPIRLPHEYQRLDEAARRAARRRNEAETRHSPVA
jgi:hypothetical protein